MIGVDRLVVVFRRGHPIRSRKLTAKRFAEADHILVSRRGHLSDLIDKLLEDQGLSRRVVASAPTSSAALHVVAETDLLVVVPGRCVAFRSSHSASIHASCHSASPGPELLMTWHQRSDDDRAHEWLRDQFRAAAAEIYEH